MKIEKLEYYSSSRDGYTFERHPNIDDITDKINEIIDKLNEKDDAKPIKHGRWKNGRCSECGCDRVIAKVYRNGELVWTATYKDNYCPNCGCKMDLDEVKK